MNDWKPITKPTLEHILRDEVGALRPDLSDLWTKYSITPVQQECWRSDLHGIEQVFVVARHQNDLLIFDDVEDEFAIGASDADGVLRSWGLCGTLSDALSISHWR